MGQKRSRGVNSETEIICVFGEKKRSGGNIYVFFGTNGKGVGHRVSNEKRRDRSAHRPTITKLSIIKNRRGGEL